MACYIMPERATRHTTYTVGLSSSAAAAASSFAALCRTDDQPVLEQIEADTRAGDVHQHGQGHRNDQRLEAIVDCALALPHDHVHALGHLVESLDGRGAALLKAERDSYPVSPRAGDEARPVAAQVHGERREEGTRHAQTSRKEPPRQRVARHVSELQKGRKENGLSQFPQGDARASRATGRGWSWSGARCVSDVVWERRVCVPHVA